MVYCRFDIRLEAEVGVVDPRLYGAFVEHMGRCVYEGIYDPDDPSADNEGFRSDVMELTKELGVTAIRYPGGNFVSGYNWEDGVGPREDRPRRIDLAWRQLETNQVGLHEFMSWAAKVEIEPIMAVNLGSRGLDAARELVEYANIPGGTTLSDLRRSNGASEPFGIRTWCLGNEMDGPWQVGHKDADTYGKLAAETAKAMRQVDPSIELVVCGSAASLMPTFAEWERVVLGHTLEYVDYVSAHQYYQPEPGDDNVGNFLASGVAMDRQIENVIATADHVAAVKRSPKRLKLAFDEWNIWYQQFFAGHTNLELAEAPHLIEDNYSELDAVVIGSLLMSLLRHADRVAIACLAQLVNVIAPIRTERGVPAWRQSIFYPFALTSAAVRGVILDIRPEVPTYHSEQYGEVDLAEAVVSLEDNGDLVILAVNRSLDTAVDLEATLPPGEWSVSDHRTIAGDPNTRPVASQILEAKTYGREPARVEAGARVDSGVLSSSLRPVSWNLIRLRTASA